MTATDERSMRRALRLALRGLGRVEPNPMVGCVIVKGGRVIGEGFHRRFGGPHAEIVALSRCRASPRGATVYVTLEPCCYHGKTPPCTEALIAAGVRRVVAGAIDPNPRVAGRGLASLRKAGLRVDAGVLEEQARNLAAPFIKLTQTGRPWVIAKWAQSLDGKIGTRMGDSKWISDEAARAHAHRVRGRVDAIVVGIGTALRDDPLLTARGGRPRRIATRVVLDTHLRTPLGSQLVRTAPDVPVLLLCSRAAPAARRLRLERGGCQVVSVRHGRDGLSLPAVLDALGARAMTNVLFEGGGRVLGGLHDQRLIDELHVYIAPRVIGGRDAIGPLHTAGAARVRDALALPPGARLRRLGGGWLLESRLTRADSTSYT